MIGHRRIESVWTNVRADTMALYFSGHGTILRMRLLLLSEI